MWKTKTGCLQHLVVDTRDDLLDGKLGRPARILDRKSPRKELRTAPPDVLCYPVFRTRVLKKWNVANGARLTRRAQRIKSGRSDTHGKDIDPPVNFTRVPKIALAVNDERPRGVIDKDCRDPARISDVLLE